MVALQGLLLVIKDFVSTLTVVGVCQMHNDLTAVGVCPMHVVGVHP